MPLLLTLKLFAGGALKNVWTFLCHRSAWQLAFGAALLLSAIEHFELAGERRHSAKLSAQVVQLSGQLKSITTAKNVQTKVSTVTVEKVIQGQERIKTVVEHIHDAPLPPDCGTPDVDELRNAL